MKNKKKNIIGLVKSVIFLIIFVFLFTQLSNLLMPKVKDEATGKYVNMISSVTALDENSVDVIFVGNSNLYCSINPTKIWLDKKITSCVISTPFLTEAEAYYKTKDILKTQSPKYIVFETDCMFETDNVFDENGYLIWTPDKKEDKFHINTVKEKLDALEQSIYSCIDSRYPLMKFNFRWKKIDLGEIKNTTRKKAFTARGYRPSKTVKAFKYGDTYMSFNHNGKEPLEEISAKYFKMLIELCRENNIELVLMTVPTGTTWNTYKHRTVSELAEQNGLHYVDFNTETNLIPDFDWKKDTKDGGNHLNTRGAKKVTKAYEDILTNDFKLPPTKLTDEQTQQWNNDADAFCQKTFGKSIKK